MEPYVELQSHLNRVRWAWKRAAALQGLAAVVMEGLGMFLLFALVDYMYSLQQPTRVAFLTIMGAVLAFLFGRHVLRPLLRVIPDDQVALYIEERQQETEGALLSATTFGKGDDKSSSALYNFIVETIVSAAVTKAGSIQLSKLVDVRKLRKYAIAAVIVLLFFGLSAFKFSSFIGARATRLLMPWQVTDEDRRAMGTLLNGEPKILFEVDITPPGGRVLRGSAIGVKAKLSRTPREDVCIKFRTKGTIEFQQLKMEEIEELNSFAIRLPDINDDLEFMIQSGREVSKTNYAVAVYDKLEIKGYELTLTPPAYTKQNTVVETSQAADITALIGTKVKFRALANTPLERGELKFDNGKELVLVGEAGERAAVGEFTIEKDAAYTVKLRSADGQDSEPGIAFMIKALTDEPPTLSVVAPASDMACHPDAEVDFTAKVQEDVGIGSVELVYNFSSGPDAPHRVPFKVEDAGPGEKELSVMLPMAELQPRVNAGDSLFYHMIVKDLKGQDAVSDIYMLKVRPFEIAGAYPSGGTHARAHAPPLDLMIFIAAVWNVHIQKDHIEKTDYDQRCDSLWEKMTDGGKPRSFKKPKISLLPPEKAALVLQGDEYVARGIEILKKHDAGAAVAELRQGLGLYERAGTGLDWKDKMPTREIGEGVVDGKPFDPMKDALGFVKLDIPTPEYAAPQYDMKLPQYRRAIKSEEAKELREETQKLQKKEQQLIDEAKKLAATKEEDKPRQNQDEKKEDPQLAQKPEDKNEQKPGDTKEQKPEERNDRKPDAKGDQKPEGKPLQRNERKGDPENQDQNSAEREERKKTLEKQQEQLANDARKLANKLAAKLQTPDKEAKDVLGHLRKSAKEMEEATKQIKEDNLQKAAARGEQAKEELVKAAEKLEVSQYDSLEKAVEAAEERALQIADEQKKIQQAANRVVEEAEKRAEKTEKKNEPKLTPQELQKMQGLAKLQVENQKNAENLENYVNEVAKWAEDVRKKDAADELKKAAKIMKQDELAATMITAAVNMGQQELEDAKANQEKLDKTLTKVTTTLQNANSALAATNEQKLKRALNETKELLAKAETLAPKPELKPDDKRTGEKKPDEKKPGDKQTAEKKPDDKQTGGKTPDGKKSDDKQTAEKKNVGKKELTPEEQAKLKAELYRDTAKLARRLDQDKLLDPKLQAQIQNEVKEERGFHGMFNEDQKPRLARYMNSIKAVSSHLEGKLESVLKARRLSAAQREQTPIQYREMVNEYYERLAKE
ncbi:MAG: hypothetical protein NTW87_00035 [Planctomycetota bacterium]|nr:hypothetical protein [Planctomycetota bacterium]